MNSLFMNLDLTGDEHSLGEVAERCGGLDMVAALWLCFLELLVL